MGRPHLDRVRSRTPVREALIRLHDEGLVELIQRRGMRVVPLAPEDMQEIYEVLSALEVAAVDLADQVHRARMTTLRLRPRPVKSIEEHREVLEALWDGDGERAARAHRRHRRNAARLLIDLLNYYRLPHL